MHRENYKNGVSDMRKSGDFKRGLESQQNVFRKEYSVSSSALRASYRVSYSLAEESKYFFDGEFVKKYFNHTLLKNFPPKKLF